MKQQQEREASNPAYAAAVQEVRRITKDPRDRTFAYERLFWQCDKMASDERMRRVRELFQQQVEREQDGVQIDAAHGWSVQHARKVWLPRGAKPKGFYFPANIAAAREWSQQLAKEISIQGEALFVNKCVFSASSISLGDAEHRAAVLEGILDRADDFIMRVLSCAVPEKMNALRGTCIANRITRHIKMPTGHHIEFRAQSGMYPTKREIGAVAITIHL